MAPDAAAAESSTFAEPALARRQVAVAFADVVGWSVLAAADETRAAERWLALLRHDVVPAAAALGGRIVDVQGDGALAEFPDAPAAVAWARRLHAAAEATGQGSADEAPIAFRIAIHVGSVIAEGERIFGEAVNLAARLQEFAVPGGTVLSAEAAAALPAADRAAARDLGPLPLRNLARPVRALSLDPPRRVAVPLPPAPGPLPSVAVLPLEDAQADPAHAHLAAGIVEDVAASLAGLHEVFVIAPESARMFLGQSPTPQRVARTLGVRFVVCGSMRRRPGGFDLSLRLVDGPTGEQLWGERLDFADRELFAAQEHAVRRVVAGVAPNIRAAALREAMRKRPESLTAYDHMLRGLHSMGAQDRAGFLRARDHLEQSMAEDAGFALPAAWAAHWHSLRIGQGWSLDRGADAAAIFALSERALAADPANALALAVLAHNTAYLRKEPEAALELFERALAACPGSAVAWTLSSATLTYLGRGEEAVRHADRGLRLSPYDPLRHFQRHLLSLAHYAAGHLDKAERYGRMAIAANASHASSWRVQAVALAAQGASRGEEAAAALARVDELEGGGFDVDRYVAERMPFRDAALRERFARDLRAAAGPAGTAPATAAA